jgi:hypothetical protein
VLESKKKGMEDGRKGYIIYLSGDERHCEV